MAGKPPVDGTPFGRYRLIELIGRGGMGEVWRAYDPTIDRVVALKVLPPNFADDQVFQERFRREARSAAGLDEPHVVPIHEFGEIEGRLYVTMRLIKGRDLQELLEDGPLPPERAVKIIEQIASALHAAHDIGLVHRDVKPSNILVAQDDFAYLIDFGIARAEGETGLTSTGATIGTWAYMAPERFRTGKADARADIYALACVLCQSLTGDLPFPANSLEQIAVAHMMEPPPKPSQLRPEVPVAMDDVIATGMAKNPDNRYATTVELADAARDVITTPILRQAPPPQPEPTPQPAPVPVPEPMATGHDAPTPLGDSTDTSARPDTLLDEHGNDLQSADAVLDYPDTPQPQQIPGPASDETLMATPQPRHGLPQYADALRATQPAELPRPPRPTGEPKSSTTPGRKSRRTKIALSAGAVVLIAVVATVIGVVTVGHQSTSSSSQTAASPQPSAASPQPSQVVLPFTGLNKPFAVAVDTAGNLYVADFYNNRVLRLAAGSTAPSELPFAGLDHPGGVAVDTVGNVYVIDASKVLKLPAGTSAQTEVPFTGVSPLPLGIPESVAVDTAGAVYLVNGMIASPVLKLAAGATTQTVLPFTGDADGVAVDTAGNVYVSYRYDNRVLKLPARSTTPTPLPFTGLNSPTSVAVDTAGSVYVSDMDNKRVLKLPAGSSTPIVLPFTGLDSPSGVAVDTAGNVYVTDVGNNRVLKLAAG